jgi:hypothetical protein
MRITHVFFNKICCNYLIIILALLMLPACTTREDQLSEHEARIGDKESELVALLTELIELRKSLKNHPSDKTADTTENLDSSKTDTCQCDTDATDKSNPASPAVTDSKTKTLIGELENVHLEPPSLEFSARIDTGARTSSLNAVNIVEFERDGKPFVKFNLIHPQTGEIIQLTRRLRRHVRIKERGDRESQRRPVVRMRVTLADINELVDFTLENRSKFKHQILIGRNLLRDLAIVDVSKKYTTLKPEKLETGNSQ